MSASKSSRCASTRTALRSAVNVGLYPMLIAARWLDPGRWADAGVDPGRDDRRARHQSQVGGGDAQLAAAAVAAHDRPLEPGRAPEERGGTLDRALGHQLADA